MMSPLLLLLLRPPLVCRSTLDGDVWPAFRQTQMSLSIFWGVFQNNLVRQKTTSRTPRKTREVILLFNGYSLFGNSYLINLKKLQIGIGKFPVINSPEL